MAPTLLFSSFHNYLDQGSGAAISAREVLRELARLGSTRSQRFGTTTLTRRRSLASQANASNAIRFKTSPSGASRILATLRRDDFRVGGVLARYAVSYSSRLLTMSCSAFEAGRLASKVASGGTPFVQPE